MRTEKTVKQMEAFSDAKEEVKKVVMEEVDEELEFGFESDSEHQSIYDQVWFVKPKTKDCAYFDMTLAGNPNKHYATKNVKSIVGRLTKIEQSSYTYENKEVDTIRLYIASEVGGKNVLFMVSMSYTQVGRSIINSLLGATEPITKIELTLYQNSAGYTSVVVLLNGKKSTWKLSIDEQRKMIETIKNKAGVFVSNDYSELDEYFKQSLETHIGILLPEMESTTSKHKVNFIEENEVDNTEVFGDPDEEDKFFELGTED